MAEQRRHDLLTQVAEYYTAKLAQHGEEPRGVDWNGAESQFLRFEQLCKIIAANHPFSMNDLGCGYGALVDHLHPRYSSFEYHGTDVSAAMIAAARRRYLGREGATFSVGMEPPAVADYAVASGIFNVRQDRRDDEWLDYLHSGLDMLHRTSRRGFAFNCLTSYSDPDCMRSDLYYADPCALFDRCKRLYSRQVALLHDYGLYEFTILVRKAP
jgi:SAM-dependent methyltransferase